MIATLPLDRAPPLPAASSPIGLGDWLGAHLAERLDRIDARRAAQALRGPVQVAVEVGRQSHWTPWRIGHAVGRGVRDLPERRENGARLLALCVEVFVSACDRRGIPVGEATVGLTESIVEVDPRLAGMVASVATHAGRDAVCARGDVPTD